MGPSGRAAVVAGVVSGGGWLLAAVFWINPPPDRQPAVIEPIESVTTDDLDRAVRALERLEHADLTPRQQSAVEPIAEVIEALDDGDATIAPEAPQSVPTPPTTAGTTTTVPPPTAVPLGPVDHDGIRDDYTYPTTTTEAPP